MPVEDADRKRLCGSPQLIARPPALLSGTTSGKTSSALRSEVFSGTFCDGAVAPPHPMRRSRGSRAPTPEPMVTTSVESAGANGSVMIRAIKSITTAASLRLPPLLLVPCEPRLRGGPGRGRAVSTSGDWE